MRQLIFFAALAATATSAQAGYYDQFGFRVLGTCDKIETVSFLSAASWQPASVGTDLKGREELVTAEIQLFDDHTYWVGYEEAAVTKRYGDAYITETLFQSGLEGTWAVSGDRIELRGLGYGTPTQVALPDGKPRDGFRFQFTRAPNDNRILKVAMDVGRVGTNVGPKGVSINQYCHH